MKLRHIYQQGYGQDDQPPETHVGQSHHFRGHPDNMPQIDDVSILVRFERFGPKKNPRNFEVEIDWNDLKWLIGAFVAEKHEHAEHLMRILKMVRGLEDSGWQCEGEPPEFWESLIES